MIAGAELVEHVAGLLGVLFAAALPGWLLSRFLHGAVRREAWSLWPALGVAYWATALYLFPWQGGLYCGTALLGLGVVVAVVSQKRPPYAAGRIPVFCRLDRAWRPPFATHHLVLLVGCLPYLSPVFLQHVPPGMDASRYLYNARLIAEQAGLPGSLAPFAPELRFGAANHGLPALAAAASLSGISPTATVLATLPLAFTALLLSLYGLLRMVSRRLPAAVIAVGTVWLARETQATPSWGGFAGVLAFALALTATRLEIEVLRHGRAGPGGLLGLCVGALPLVHGCMAAGWLYLLAPPAGLVGLALSRRRGTGLAALLAAAGVAGLIFALFFVTARPSLSPAAADWIRQYELPHGHAHGPLPYYLARALGGTLTLLAVCALAWLLATRRWGAASLVVAMALLCALVIHAGAREWLPGSLLLYPSRLREFLLPAAALALALAWRGLAARNVVFQGRGAILAGVLLLTLGFGAHLRYFQHSANGQRMPEGVWAAIQWLGANLDPAQDLVATEYGAGGAYLPGVAGIAATGLHIHIADFFPWLEQMLSQRSVTHVLLIDAPLQPASEQRRVLELLVAERGGGAVFENAEARVYRLESRRPLKAPPAAK